MHRFRGRWTLKPNSHPFVIAILEGPHVTTEPVEVVPVPDEAAIERGAKAYAEQEGNVWDEFEAEEHKQWYRDAALAVLRAALEAPEKP